MSTSPYRSLLAHTILPVPENAVGRTESSSDIPIAWRLDLCPDREVRRLGYDTELVPELADGFRQFVGEVDSLEVGVGRALQFPGPPKPPAGRRPDSVENGIPKFSVQEAFRGFQLLFLAIFDDLKNRHPACGALRGRSYHLSHRSKGLDDVQLHLWSPSFPKAEIPVLQWSYEDSQVLDDSAPLVEELSRSWASVSISRGLPSPYRPISKALYWTSHKNDIPAYFVTSYKRTVLFLRRGSTLYAAPIISAGCDSSSNLIPCIMGLILSRCAEVGLLDYYPTPESSLPVHHSAVPKAAATALVPLSTCSAASQQPRETTNSLCLGFGNEDPHSLKNPYDLVWLNSSGGDFAKRNIRSIVCSSSLGFGHMGNVYRGVTDTGLEVAVKIVSGKTNRTALRHEWEIYATLMGFGATGETIPVCYGFADSGGPEDESGFSALVLECIGDGKPAVNDFYQLPPQDREYLFQAMRDLHSLGFINRDLTSRNVVRDKHGRLRIIDLEHVRHHKCHLSGSGFGQRRESILNCEDFRCTVVRLRMDDL